MKCSFSTPPPAGAIHRVAGVILEAVERDMGGQAHGQQCELEAGGARARLGARPRPRGVAPVPVPVSVRALVVVLVLVRIGVIVRRGTPAPPVGRVIENKSSTEIESSFTFQMNAQTVARKWRKIFSVGGVVLLNDRPAKCWGGSTSTWRRTPPAAG